MKYKIGIWILSIIFLAALIYQNPTARLYIKLIHFEVFVAKPMQEQRLKEDKEARTNVYEKVAIAKDINEKVFILYRWWEIVKQDFREDPNSFEYLGNFYSIDKFNVYYHNEIFEWVDPESFIMFPHYWLYTKDKNNVYFLAKVIPEADLETFEMLKSGYGKDKNNYYLNWRPEDPKKLKLNKEIIKSYHENIAARQKEIEESFFPNENKITELWENFYSYQKNIFYIPRSARELDRIKYISNEANPIDYDSFEVLSESYAKDKNNIYYIDTGTYNSQGSLQMIENADYNSFLVTDRHYAKDINNVYFLWKIR